MNRVYENRINWENYPSQDTPINETNLNKMDSALFTIDGRVCDQDITKANQSDLLQCLKSVDYATASGIFTFIWQNGTRKTIDLNVEKIPVSFEMSAAGVITMTTADGTKFTCDVSTLIKDYIFSDSSEIDFVVVEEGNNRTVTASIISGSITEDKLQPNFLADCKTAKDTAVEASSLAEGYAVGKQGGTPVTSSSPYYHNNAKYFSDNASASAQTASGAVASVQEYSESALASATNASSSEYNAQQYSVNASNYANTASAYKDSAKNYSDTAKTYKDNAGTYADSARTYSEASVSASESAEESATSASASATSASSSASSASTSALSASAYASQSESYALISGSAAENAEETLSEIQKELALPEFSIDFTTGHLTETDNTKYAFSIDDTTGNLTWEVSR